MFKDLPTLRLLKWFGGAGLAVLLIGWSYLFHFPYYSNFFIYLEEEAVFLGGLVFLSLLGFYLVFIPLQSFVRRQDRLNYYLQRIQRLGVKLQEIEDRNQLFERAKKQVVEELPFSACALYNYNDREDKFRLIFGSSAEPEEIEDQRLAATLPGNETRIWQEENPPVTGWQEMVTQPVHGLEGDFYLLALKGDETTSTGTFHRLIAHRFGEQLSGALRQNSLRRREEKNQERLNRRIEKATAELKQQREFLSAVLNSLDEGLLVFGGDSQLNLVNPRARELLQLPEREGDNYSFTEVEEKLPEEIIANRESDFSQLIKTDGQFLEYEWQAVEGTQHSILLLRDRTRREKLQRRLQINQTLEMLGEMASSVVHELRNPLGGMEMYVGLLRRRADNPELQKPVEKISEALQAIQRITEGLLNFTRAGEPSFEKINPNQLFSEVLKHCRQRLERNSIEVENRLPDLKQIKGDVEQLRSVFVNLIQNAIEAQGEGGKIVVQGENKDEEIVIAVRDYGEGLTEEEQAEAFNRFFSTKEEGTGLGLAISENLVEVHSGEIKVESTPGEGSTFSVILPLSPVEISGGEKQDGR